MADETLQRTQARFLKELFYGGKGGLVLKGGRVVTALFDPARLTRDGKAEVSPKWKVSGRTAHGEPFHMKVEVSRRPPPPGKVRQATVSGVSAFGLGAYYVDLYDEETLVAMKLAALLGRTAARDVTDLDVLLPKHHPSAAMIEWHWHMRGLIHPMPRGR